ncbi:MAG: thioredoxin [Clostridiaceae bacterium]|nr:thioredoxin [Clostridiaceae bacterium]
MIELNTENFDVELINFSEKPVFVDFWGEKCEICKALMPGVEDFEKKYGDKIKFTTLNTTGFRRLAISQKVLGLPTMLIYRNGVKISSITPDKISTLEDIENFIREVYDKM